jgi:hypothetical protein
MDKALISAKNKKVKTWLEQSKEAPNEEIRKLFVNKVNAYKMLLVELWGISNIESSLINKIESLEREIDNLYNSVRLERSAKLKF